MSAHMDRIIAKLQIGDVRGAQEEVDAASRIARELKQPAQLWQVGSTEALLALAAGRLGEAEELIERTFAFGEHAQPTAAFPVHALQRHTLAEFRGTFEGVEPAIRNMVAEYPARPVFRCALALLHARLGRLPEAKRELDDLAWDDFSALPFDQEWLYGMSLLAETCALLDARDSAAVIHRLLLPWAELNAVDVGEGMRGSVFRYLGLMATTTEHWDEAARYFEDALEMNERMGAWPWLAHTQHDYARMLLARGSPADRERAQQLLDAALTTYRELGMEGCAQSESSTRSMR